MKAIKFILAGGVGLAAMAVSAPAAAQYYPYGGGNVIGQVLGQVLGGGGYGGGYGGYGASSQMAVNQCSAAVADRINRQYGGYNRGYGYGGYGAYNGYGGGARVVAITSVEPRSSGRLRVRGIATTNAYGAGYGGYNGGYANGGELAFKCNIDYRGYISDIDLDRVRSGYGGGYGSGYGYQPYGNYRRY